jgi:tryptophan-rich sensory protein
MGAVFAIVLIALTLVIAGYSCLAREGRQPAWHHHLARPFLASLVMVPACLILLRWHVLAAVMGGAVAYLIALTTIGGLRRSDLTIIFSRN